MNTIGTVYVAEKDGPDLIVHVALTNPVGELRLRILNYTWEPLPGMVVLDGSGFVHIHRDPGTFQRYTRLGVALRESTLTDHMWALAGRW